MAVSPGSPARYRAKRGRGRFYFVMFVFAFIFAGGFYVGVRATRHVEKLGPEWLKTPFGVQSGWMGTPAAAPNSVPAPPLTAAPASPNPTVAPAAPTSGAAAAPPAASAPNTLPESRPVPPAGAAAPGTAEALDANVAEYNAVLHRMDNAFHDYMIATQNLSPAGMSAEEQRSANDHAHTAAQDLQAYVHRAQSLYDAVHADPLFTKKYKETDRALDPAAVRAQFQELAIDNLRYFRKKE